MYFWKYLLEEFRDLTFFYYCLFVSDCTGSSLLNGLFFSCGELRLLSSCSVRASRCRAQAVGLTGFSSCCTCTLSSSLGDLPDSGIKPVFPALQVDSLPAELSRKPHL